MSFSIKDRVYHITREYVYLGIAVLFLGIAGVMVPQLYDGYVDDVMAETTFSAAATISEEALSHRNILKLQKINGVYYTSYLTPALGGGLGDITIATSTDGVNWGFPYDAVSGTSPKDYGFGYYEQGGYFYAVFSDYNYGNYNTTEIVFTTSSDAITWSATSTVFDLPINGFNPDIFSSMVSSSNYLSFAYYDDDVIAFVVATSTDGSSWSTSTIASDIFGAEGFAVDGNGTMHALYTVPSDENFDQNTQVHLYYASSTDDGNTWTSSVIDRVDYQSYVTEIIGSIAVDNSGNPGIAYYTSDEISDFVWTQDGDEWSWAGDGTVTTSLKYAKYADSDWSSSTIATIPLSIVSTTDGLSMRPSLTFNEDNEAIFAGAWTSFYPNLFVNTDAADTSQFDTTQIDNKSLVNLPSNNVGLSLFYNTSTDDVVFVYSADDGSGSDMDLFFVTSSVLTVETVLDPPSNLAVTPSDTDQINVSWDAVSGATSYVLYRDTNSGFTDTTTVTTTASTSYSDTGLVYGTTYYYKVATVNGAGTGTPSASVNTSTVAWDGSLSTVLSVDTNSFTRLIYANSQYYYFYTNSPDSDYNIYLTTSTDGTDESWSEPNEIVSTIKSITDPVKPIYDILYDSTDDYFGLTYYVSSTGVMAFTTSSDGVTWATNVPIYTELVADNVFMNNLSISDGTSYIAVGYGVNEVAYSSDTGATWSTSSLGLSGDSSSLINIEIDSSGYLHAAYIDESTPAFVYTSSTDNGDTWSSSTIYTASNYDFGHDKFMLDGNERPALLFGDRTSGSYETATGNMYFSVLEDGAWSEGLIREIDFPYTTDSELAFSDLNFYGARPYMVYVGESSYPDFAYSTSTADPFTMNVSENYGSNGEVVGEQGKMSMAYDSSNTTVAVAYVNSSGELKFVTSSMDLVTYTPGTPTAVATSDTTMTVTWSANSNLSGTTYELYNVTDSEVIDTTTEVSYSVTGLTAETSYQFKVRAQYVSDDSLYTDYSANSTAVSTDAADEEEEESTPVTSGGGSSPAPSPPPAPSTAAPASVSVVVTPNAPQAVSVGNASHTVTASAPGADGAVTILIQSDPVTIILKPGEEELIDTDSNFEDDLFVRLDSVDGDNVSLTIAAIDDLEFSINKALSTTDSRNVKLYFNSPEATQMAISDSSDFSGVSFQSYKDEASWILTKGNGTKTIYVRFRTAAGGTRTVTDTIVLEGQDTDQVEQGNECGLTSQKAYKYASSPSVYYVTDDCTKRAFSRSDIFFTYFDSWNDVHLTTKSKLDAISNDTLGFMPLGPNYDPKYGALVKVVSSPRVYLLLGTEKYWITSPDVFTSLNYAWGWIEDVDERLLEKYTTGSEITYTDHHPNYTLVKYENDSKIYRLEPQGDRQVKRWIAGEDAFNSLNFRWDRIVTISEEEVYDTGEELSSASSQVQSSGSYMFSSFLSFGDSGEEVKQLQLKLQELNYLSQDIEVNSHFGPSTKEAVMKLQQEHNLTPAQGYVGPGTRAVLNSL
ncbi:hypothetical protein C0581_03500 [Candidatus Parcubacteria bacterium]|nr:MAG: hypothetical protein C0581_03500 [Candidatus Parcubacteria bacterium]